MLNELSRLELNKPEFKIGLVNNEYCLLTSNGHPIGKLSQLTNHDISLRMGDGGGCYLFRERQGVLGIIKNYTPIDYLPTLSRMSYNECWHWKDAKAIAKRLNQPLGHVLAVCGRNKNT